MYLFLYFFFTPIFFSIDCRTKAGDGTNFHASPVKAYRVPRDYYLSHTSGTFLKTYYYTSSVYIARIIS